MHGAVGIWDEAICLIIPATAIMGVALAVLREKAPYDGAEVGADEGADAGDDTETDELPAASAEAETAPTQHRPGR